MRHRLTHADPDAPRPSDPIEPLVYYLSPEIPDRWRPYVRAAIEDWQPAFEAAGFSNAIVARDAPSPEEDPDWSINDASNNVIRWIAQPIANALGPNVHDPRSGEIISAHILVWPDVLNVFSDYYYLLMSDLDPRARTLPLPEDVQGRILRYAVSHEVGHTLGLRHNHFLHFDEQTPRKNRGESGGRTDHGLAVTGRSEVDRRTPISSERAAPVLEFGRSTVAKLRLARA